ncbi:hypothetical protein ACFL3C_05460, partial [Patescibacteria group bacterium]
IFKGYVEVVKTMDPKKQAEATKDMVAATKKRRTQRRLRMAAKSTPEGYRATPEKQREFEQRLKEIQATNDRGKLVEIAKKYRESTSNSEAIVVYPNKRDLYGRVIMARRNTLLVYACFVQSIKLLNEQTGSNIRVNLWSSLRTIKKQRDIRRRTEKAQMIDVTAEYKKKFEKKGMNADEIKKELNKPKIKNAIRREALRRTSYLAAKATKSNHLTGGALDISVSEEYLVTIKGKQRKRKRSLTNYTFRINYGKNQTPALVRKAIAGDKVAYSQLNSHNRKSVRAAIYLFEKTGMRDIYTKKTEISSELWHKDVGKGIYKIPPQAGIRHPRKRLTKKAAPVNIPKRPEIKEKAPEEWPNSLETQALELPSHRLYCTLIKPKVGPRPGQKVVIMPFFSGKFRSNGYTRFRERRGTMKPPAHIAELVAKKYLLDKDKRAILAWQKEMSKKDTYVVIAFLSEIHTGRTNPGSMWYHDFKRRYLGKDKRGRHRREAPEVVHQRVSAIFSTIRDGVARLVNKEPERGIRLAGTSMGGLPIERITRYIKEGAIDLKLDMIFNSDSTYWRTYKTCQLVKQSRIPWLVSFRRGTSTASQSKVVIRYFKLKKHKHPTGKGWVYINPEYPYVVVRESTAWGVSHGRHPSYFLPEAWENSSNNRS